jgi:hypothetical protein
MNYTAARKIYSAPAIRPRVQHHESLLQKVSTWLKPVLSSRRLKYSDRDQHQSFMEANLLDEVMGPEISRTLRR